MDSRRFDNLTRSLATTANRRRILKGLSGVTLGSLGLIAAAKPGSAQEGDAEGTVFEADRRCRRRCLRLCRRRRGDDCRERCCRGGDNDD